MKHMTTRLWITDGWDAEEAVETSETRQVRAGALLLHRR